MTVKFPIMSQNHLMDKTMCFAKVWGESLLITFQERINEKYDIINVVNIVQRGSTKKENVF